ncbi:MAG: HD domain-containing phosphohydrolase [Betaproteobacteria bacterium]
MAKLDKLSKVLVCDDSQFDLEFLVAELHSEGFKDVRGVGDPRQVMSLLEQEVFDLVLLDIEMPFIDGVGLTRQIREKFSKIQLPILVVTASDDKNTRNRALSCGANDYLIKPFDRIEMNLRVDNLLMVRNVFKAQQEIERNLEREVKARTSKLDMLIDTGIKMSMVHDRTKLLENILQEGKKFLHCDAATMYLVTEDKSLRFVLRTREDSIPLAEIPLVDMETGLPNEKYVSTYVAIHNAPILIDDVYQETRFDLSGTRKFDAGSNYRTVSMLTVPMSPRNGQVIGVLQFLNALDPVTNAVVPFPPDVFILIEALASQAAVALDNLLLVEAHKDLMENMIKVIATAIDAKSPYTGRHCSRVPELGLILAKVASDVTSGPLADFRFSSEEEWREFRIGAWLHDCGKVTTPEYVIDKATKLETIYNRLHEIRMRFEVLLRDAKIERLSALQKGENPAQVNSRYDARKATLLDDFAFVAECNVGSEAMTDARVERLAQIAQATWLRHFDDRLGLSREEEVRLQSVPVQALPVIERLLDDKPNHRVPRELGEVPDPSFGFRIEIPEHRYNHGEIYNLSIRRGTLTKEERYKIYEHMIFTVIMLEQMGFPKQLKRVIEYATTHHETLNSDGYPRQLGPQDLSIPARILAIADIFEALTAPDRPYKRPSTVSEAVKILFGMKMRGNIDPDLFDLFLTSGAYLRYAEKYLNAEQIDALDITLYLAKGPVAPRPGI